MKWSFVQFQIYDLLLIYRMFVIHRELVKHIASSSNLLRVHWTNCIFVKFIIRDEMTHMFFCWYFCTCFDFRQSLIYANLLLRMRFMRSRIFAIEYSYEHIKNSVLTIDNRIDEFFLLRVLETIYDEKIYRKMSKSNLIDIFILIWQLHWKQFHEISIDSNHS